MQGINTFFYIIVLIMSVVIHEVAHGLIADSQGDPTARYAGRLTLNPLKHIDMVGSIILPLLLVIFNTGFIKAVNFVSRKFKAFRLHVAHV